MKKSELKELYQMMFPEYPDIVTVRQLREMLGISRTQLRDILASLDREGFITRRHGVGTIINRHVLGAPARMDIEVEFLDMIRQSGHTPGVAFVRAADDKADSKVAAQLGKVSKRSGTGSCWARRVTWSMSSPPCSSR